MQPEHQQRGVLGGRTQGTPVQRHQANLASPDGVLHIRAQARWCMMHSLPFPPKKKKKKKKSVHIALRLVNESDSISRSSVSFCLSTSRIAPSSARELDTTLSPWLSILSLIFLLLPSAYQAPIPADAFSQPLRTAEPSVLTVARPPVSSISLFTLAGSLSLRNGSSAFPYIFYHSDSHIGRGSWGSVHFLLLFALSHPLF